MGGLIEAPGQARVSSEPFVPRVGRWGWGRRGHGQSLVFFWMGAGETFSMLTEAPGQLPSQSTTVMGCLDESNAIISVIL